MKALLVFIADLFAPDSPRSNIFILLGVVAILFSELLPTSTGLHFALLFTGVVMVGYFQLRAMLIAYHIHQDIRKVLLNPVNVLIVCVLALSAGHSLLLADFVVCWFIGLFGLMIRGLLVQIDKEFSNA